MKRNPLPILIAVIIVSVIATMGAIMRVSEVSVDINGQNIVAEEIINVSQIKRGGSILSLNELDAINRIESAYADNSVKVEGIERVFPNKVIIYIKERTPIFAVKRENTDKYILTDIDFQMSRNSDANTDLANYIVIKGITVNVSFDTQSFKILNEIFNNLQDKVGDLKSLVSEVQFGDVISIKTRDDFTMNIDKNASDFEQEVSREYTKYINSK